MAFAVLAALATAGEVLAQEGDSRGPPAPDEWLVLDPVDARGRRPFHPDAVFAQHLLDRRAAAPLAGRQVVGELGVPQAWERREVADHGGPEGAGMAWAHTSLSSPDEQVVLVSVQGASTFFVNGDGFAGDVYRYGWPGVPVHLREGGNDVYVTGIRGGFGFAVTAPTGPLVLGDFDHTLPDLVAGSVDAGPVGLLVMNASTEPLPCLEATTSERELLRGIITDTGAGLVPLGVRKVPLSLIGRDWATVPESVDRTEVHVRVGCLRDVPGAAATEQQITLRIVAPTAPRRRTFVSRIDGSVQFYGLLPPAPSDEEATGLVLTLHGAGVDAYRQVTCYAPRPDAWVVAPTNRRPFGFDWQDWGRQDAYEVLDDALAFSGAERRRVFLTGHSMGGHGTWHLAANDPDGFAAISPSAGWRSFDTYGGRPEGLLSELWHGADGSSLTDELIDNLALLPTFVVHGGADDNVPVAEAREIVAALRVAGGAPGLHVQEGAGHWWDGDASPGVDCVDWPAATELFRRSSIPTSPQRLEFVTMGPHVDSRHHWITVTQVQRPGEPARISAASAHDKLAVRTENVRRLDITAPAGRRAPGSETELRIDGQSLVTSAGMPTSFERTEPTGGWSPAAPLPPGQKRPERSGPFKRAFDRGFLFVVGTHGSDEETAALLARARYDAQVWWYRGNGDAPVVTDQAFLGRDDPDRNVILYGNADTNAAWESVVPANLPLSAQRGLMVLGEDSWEGDDLGAVFVAPRRESDVALVGGFADTGPIGSRLGYNLAPFVSGVGYPDYAVFDAGVLRSGDGGVLASGWFDTSWRLRPDAYRAER